MLLAKWDDYEIIDASKKEKLERWGNYYLLRPDPQIIWDSGNILEKYSNIDTHYIRSNKGGGYWENIKSIPDKWEIKYKDLTFNIKQMGFKHTGLFPEQAVNWDFIIDIIKTSKRDIKVLNLFAYTGASTVSALSAGASVVHVDSSKGMIEWAKENVKSSNLEDRNIRFIVDDVVKFVKREIRRGNKYDAIIMDPPSYGKGSNGEIWSIEDNLDELIELTSLLLSEKPLFFLISTYSESLSKEVVNNLFKIHILSKYKGIIDTNDIGLSIKNSDLILPCGMSGRFIFDDK
jgi:23S rRNA (cytosine1962-C5)-methyltransferase